MVGQPAMPAAGDDRLARASAMVNDAVALLLKAMDEIKGEEGHHGDERDVAGEPVGDGEKPGRGRPSAF